MPNLPGGPVPVWKKYTTGSKGIWEVIRQWLALVPNRSTGNPYVPYNRNPPPFSRPEAKIYTDPGTLPQIDVANSPYWKRDFRRLYPRLAFYDQPTIAGLLTVGSKANPRLPENKEESISALEKIKNSISTGLVINSQGKVTGSNDTLTTILSGSSKNIIFGSVLDKDGLPPKPVPTCKKDYKPVSFEKSGMYDTEEYPCRTFT